jgi:hypothetical protein
MPRNGDADHTPAYVVGQWNSLSGLFTPCPDQSRRSRPKCGWALDRDHGGVVAQLSADVVEQIAPVESRAAITRPTISAIGMPAGA